MAQHVVKCVIYGKELPGLEEPPWAGELGQRIYENVSEQAWELWVGHLRMLINEYRLNLAAPETQEFISEQMEKFFFGPGSQAPEGYQPPG